MWWSPEVNLVPMHYRAHAPVTEDRAKELNARVVDLREAGLSYPAISSVLGVYEGVFVNEKETRSWCKRLGLPTNPNKARPRAVAA